MLLEQFEIESGNVISRRVVEDLLARTDESEIWSLSPNKNVEYLECIKLTLIKDVLDEDNLEYYLKNRSKESYKNKILEKLKNSDVEYNNYILLSGFEYIPKINPYFFFGFEIQFDVVYKIMERMKYSLNEYVNPISELINLFMVSFYHFHKMGYVFNNVSPNNLMFREEPELQLCLIDLKYMTHDGTFLRTDSKNVFYSSNIVNSFFRGNNPKVSPLDDYESFVYIIHYLKNKKNFSFNSSNEEINSKNTLNFLDKDLKELLISLRSINRKNNIDVLLDQVIDLFDIYKKTLDLEVPYPKNMSPFHKKIYGKIYTKIIKDPKLDADIDIEKLALYTFDNVVYGIEYSDEVINEYVTKYA